MITEWTRHIDDPAAKARFEETVFSSKETLDRLKALLSDYYHSLDNKEVDETSYDTPGWEYKQAHRNGYRSCLSKIYTLIDLDQQKKKQT